MVRLFFGTENLRRDFSAICWICLKFGELSLAKYQYNTNVKAMAEKSRPKIIWPKITESILSVFGHLQQW